MNTSLLQQVEHVLARFVLHEESSAASLVALCSMVERRGVTCGIGRHDEPAAGASAASRIARLTAPNRAFLTPNDDRWAELFDASDAARTSATWVACEPVLDAGGRTRAAVVVIGSNDEARDEVLVALPTFARACAAVLSREHDALSLGNLTHRMNNLLTSVIVNVGHASHILTENATSDGAGVRVSVADHDELLHALRNTIDGAKQLAVHIAEVGRPR